MLLIPQIIDPSVPIGKDDSENVEVQRFGEAKTPDFPIPYHTEIMEPSAALTWTRRAASPETASITSWATSPGSMRRCWPMAGTS